MNLTLREIKKKLANELLELQAAEQAIYMNGGECTNIEYISILGRLKELSEIADKIKTKCAEINGYLSVYMNEKIEKIREANNDTRY